MDSNEFLIATRVLGWSNDDTASSLDVDPRTVRRWAAGGQPAPQALAAELETHLSNLDADEALDAVRDAAELLEASRRWLELACVAAVTSGVSVADVSDTSGKTRQTIYRWAGS